MKAWTGALIAVLTIGLIVFGLGMRSSAGRAAGQAEILARAPQANAMVQPAAMTTGGTAAAVGPATESAQAPMLVNCGPGQQALIRQVVLANGQLASQVDCVGVAGAAVAYGAQSAYPAYPAAQVRTVVDDEIVTAPRVVRTQTYRAPARRVVERSRRNWGKTALVIGGSTAAGAGVGGLIGGKKGALIGAALGGGASTIYEAVKR
jgi:hypothetical protein